MNTTIKYTKCKKGKCIFINHLHSTFILLADCKLSAMTDIMFLPLRLNELEALIEKSVRKGMAEQKPSANTGEEELPINIKEASGITGLAIPTLYTKISRRTIPAHRQAGRIYFFKSELLDWIRSGRRKTVNEIEADAMHSLDRGGEG